MTFAEENFAKQWKIKFDEMKNEIVHARETWKRNSFASYSFVARKDVGGVSSPWNRSPVLIKVNEYKTVSVELVDNADVSMLARTDGFEEFDTIDKLFDYMLKQLEEGQMVRADYDEKIGFPKLVSIARSFDTHGIRGITISKFSRADQS